jgi:protein TonB
MVMLFAFVPGTSARGAASTGMKLKRAQLSAAGPLFCGEKEELAVFEQTFIATQKTMRERAIALALVAQAVVVAGVGLLPILGVEPLGPLKQFVALPPLQLAPEPLLPTVTKPTQSSILHRIFQPPSTKVYTPGAEQVLSLDPIGIPGPLPGNSPTYSSVPFGLPVGEIGVAPPAPAPRAKPPSLPVRLTSTIAQSQLIYGPKPAYPQLAMVSRSEGTVKLQAIINRDGNIENLHLVSGPALLVNAAMEAVRTWRYRPLLLNGEPVEVITEIDVIFTLQR